MGWSLRLCGGIPGKAKDFPVTYLGKCEPTLEVTRPYGYVVPAEYTAAIDTLGRHGIVVDKIKRGADAAVDVYRVDKLTTAAKPFQGHKLVTVEATARKEKRHLPAGCAVIRTGALIRPRAL